MHSSREGICVRSTAKYRLGYGLLAFWFALIASAHPVGGGETRGEYKYDVNVYKVGDSQWALLTAVDGGVFIEALRGRTDTEKALPKQSFKRHDDSWQVEHTDKGSTFKCPQGYLAYDPEGKKDGVFLANSLGPGAFWVYSQRGSHRFIPLGARRGDKMFYINLGTSEKFANRSPAGYTNTVYKLTLTEGEGPHFGYSQPSK